MPNDRKRRSNPVAPDDSGMAVRGVAVDAMRERDELRAALGDVLDIVTRTGGFMWADDQARLRNARRVHGGS